MTRFVIIILIQILALFVVSCSKDEPITVGPNEIPSLYDLERIEFNDKVYLKVQSSVYDFIIIFELEGEMADHRFQPGLEIFPVVMEDEEGGHWNVFGECVNGPFEGQKLKSTNATWAYWFTWINIFQTYSLNGITKTNPGFTLDNPDWNIPTSYVNEGAKFDAIPSIDTPVFEVLTFKECLIDYDFLREDDKVIVASVNDEVKVYPIKILDHHEIVNDFIGGLPVVITYAPYTGSPSVHVSRYKNQDYTFGVSGQIYMNNILMFDRQTASFWSQLLNRVVNGQLIDAELEPVSFILVDWNTWKNAADEYTILSEEQGFAKDYRIPMFESYIANDNYLPFDVPFMDETNLNKSSFYGLSSDDEVLLFEDP